VLSEEVNSLPPSFSFSISFKEMRWGNFFDENFYKLSILFLTAISLSIFENKAFAL